jgi:spermidine synthase
MRILKDRVEFSDLIARVFAFDYVGALAASLLFPLLLVPHLGLVRSALLFGLLNACVAVAALAWLGKGMPWARPLKVLAALTLALLALGFAYGERITTFAEASGYPGQVLYAKSSPFQRILLTRDKEDLRLYLGGHLQFSSKDEYRYHEALVHPGLAALPQARSVLILGGGDGMAAREVLKYPGVERVVLVDLDAQVTELFKGQESLAQLNGGSLSDPRLQVVNRDAFLWMTEAQEQFDFVVADFPDPSSFSVGKLYSTRFYERLSQRLVPGGILTVQSTSPLLARRSYWSVAATLEAVGFRTEPYHVFVPSFGEWGFLMAMKEGSYQTPTVFPAGLRYLTAETLASARIFPPDMARVPAEPNRLTNQLLVRTYESEWSEHL